MLLSTVRCATNNEAVAAKWEKAHLSFIEFTAQQQYSHCCTTGFSLPWI